jgi:translation initiation factor 2B subunit (eIF-2B alpha/beta/delta family)
VASNRDAGAAELLAALLPLLGDAIAEGEQAAQAVVRLVCAGQPAMASLWNASAVALAEFTSPGRFARVRAEMEGAPRALAKMAIVALRDAFRGSSPPRVVTLSYSSSVAAALSAIARAEPLEVVCSESQPGGEGQRLRDELAAAGARVSLVSDALLTTFLPGATAVVVGADAISARDWTNKAGTFGLAAAASFTGTPVYVVASRDKAQADALRARAPLPRAFERTPVLLATLFLTDSGPISPMDVATVAGRFTPEVEGLLALL